MRTHSLLAAAALSTAMIAAAGCSDEPNIVVPNTGFLTATWTIGGAAEASRCQELGVSLFRLEVFDEDGYWVADRSVPCSNFDLSMRLFEGTYIASASLLDPGGAVIGSVEDVRAFVIEEDDEQFVEVDFPYGG